MHPRPSLLFPCQPIESVSVAARKLLWGQSVMVALAGMIIACGDGMLGENRAFRLSCFLSFLILGFGLYSWAKTNRDHFNLYIFFWIGACALHTGRLLLFLFGLGRTDILESLVPSSRVVSAAELANLGLATTHLGAVLISTLTTAPQNAGGRQVSPQILRTVGGLLVAIAILPTAGIYQQLLMSFAQGGYFALFDREAWTDTQSRTFILALFAVPGILFLLAGSRDSKWGRTLALSLGILLIGVNLYVGIRSLAVGLIVGLPMVWHCAIRPVKLRVIVPIFAIVGLAVLPIVALVRLQNVALVSADAVADSEKQLNNLPTVLRPLDEAGYSLLTLALTQEYVPSRRDYDHGQSYAYAALTVIPSIFFSEHPTYARGYLADYLVRQHDPGWADAGGGYGNSYIAESYFNFSWWGVWLVCLPVGAGVAYLSRLMKPGSTPLQIAMIGCMIGPVLFFCRGESATLIRNLAWYGLLPALLAIVLESLRPIGRRS